MMDIQYLGNQELLKLQKTAFLASNTIPIRCINSIQFTRDFHCGLYSAVVVYSCLYSCNSHKYIFLSP